MNIIYDISVLGIGFYAEWARTGVARVVHCLANELSRQLSGQIRFSASASLREYARTCKFISSGAFLNDGLLCESSGFLSGRALSKFVDLYPPPSSPRIFQRIFDVASLFPDCSFRSPGELSLSEADIYHSPFFPFPKYTDGIRSLTRFITVNDLIPIRCPSYFSMGEDKLIRRVIEGIGPDDWVFAISESTKNDLCDYSGIDPKRVFVTHLAAADVFQSSGDDRQAAAVLTRWGIPRGNYVLAVGTLEPRKNIERTIRAFSNLIEQQGIRDLYLVLVGPRGWNYDRIFKEASGSERLKERVIVPGFVSDEDLAVLYSNAMMFVYPSYYEGFGLPPLEAMRCGTPVITSNTSSLPEIVGDSGIMVDPSRDDEISHAMYCLYSDPQLRRTKAEMGLARAGRFNWAECARQTSLGYRVAMGAR